MILSVACDSRGEEGVRPWVEAADPSFPVLVDVQHRVAELYNMVNVPTAVWIDEAGRIARPGETAFVDNRFQSMSGIDATPYLDALRDWAGQG